MQVRSIATHVLANVKLYSMRTTPVSPTDKLSFHLHRYAKAALFEELETELAVCLSKVSVTTVQDLINLIEQERKETVV